MDWITLTYVFAGLVAWRRRPESRFGPLMIAAGFAAFLSGLSSANAAALFTIGIAFDLVSGGPLPARVPRVPDRPARADGCERALVTAGYVTAFGLQFVGLALGGFGPDNLLQIVARAGHGVHAAARRSSSRCPALCAGRDRSAAHAPAPRRPAGAPRAGAARRLLRARARHDRRALPVGRVRAHQRPARVRVDPARDVLRHRARAARVPRSGCCTRGWRARRSATCWSSCARTRRRPTCATRSRGRCATRRWRSCTGCPSSRAGPISTASRSTLADASGRPGDDADRPPRHARGRARCTTRRWTTSRSCSTRSPPPPRSRSRTRACMRSCARAWTSCRARARASSKPATPSAAGSSATCTTARSSGSSRCRSACGCVASQHRRPTREAEQLLAAARDELAASLQELRELARGIHPAVLTDHGLSVALDVARRARAGARDARRRARRAAARAGRGRRVLHGLRGARRTSRNTPRPRVRPWMSRARRGRRRSRSPTTASAAPTTRAARACAGSPTASRRSTARCASRARPAQGTTRAGGDPVRVVVADDACCSARASRACSARPASTSSARARRRRTCSPTCDDARARRRDRRHPDAADPHRRGSSGGARDPRAATRQSGVVILSQHADVGLATQLLAEQRGWASATCSRSASTDLDEFAGPLRRVADGRLGRSTRRSWRGCSAGSAPTTRSTR